MPKLLPALALLLLPPAAAAQGLDALDDGALYSELAARGLDSLLDRAFEQNNVPMDERRSFKVLSAVRELGGAGSGKLSGKEREQLVDQLVAGVGQSVLATRDPNALMQQAALLIEHALTPNMNTLEYWGENPRLRAEIKPVAETVVRIYERVAKDAQDAAAALEKKITTASDNPAARQWEEMEGLVQTATYSRMMAVYYLTASLDPDDAKRKDLATEAVNYLKQFDTPDSGVQPVVRNRVAKLNLTRGDFTQARNLFMSVAEPSAEMDPQPNSADRYEAMYFAAQAALLEGLPDMAADRHAALVAWQRAAFADNPQALAGADAAARVLEYRIAANAAERATDESAKREANDRAVAILMGLLKDRPELKSIIYQQLLDRLPADADMAQLDPLMLVALVQRGDAERLKPATEKSNEVHVEQATSAARELAGRKGQAGIDDETVDYAQLVLGIFLQKLGRTAEAAEAFLDYAESRPVNLDRTKFAMDSALAAVADLRKADMQGDATARITDRFLPLAVDKFGRTVFAYEYARRLQLGGDFARAAEYFRKVPRDDARALDARFFELISHKQHLDATQEPATRAAALSALDALGGQLPGEIGAAIAKADAARQPALRAMLARTKLVLADVARRDRGDAKAVIAALTDFETTIAGLPNAAALLGEALFLRVNAYMQLGQATQATAALVDLLNTRPGPEGIEIVVDLLRRLGDDLDRARAAGDTAAMRTIADNRAQLSGFLVDWAEKNPGPDAGRLTYRYRVFDADTKYLSATLAEDPARRDAALRESLAMYRALQSPENAELYKQAVAGRANVDPDYGDPSVMLGVALIEFELGNFTGAQPVLAKLLNDRKLGLPTMVVSENGQDRVTDNVQFWEATYKLYRSNVELSKAGGPDAEQYLTDTKGALRRQYVQWGDTVGGKKWADEFERLRAEIIPEFDVPDLSAPATAPAGG